jgi:hypothetical protein
MNVIGWGAARLRGPLNPGRRRRSAPGGYDGEGLPAAGNRRLYRDERPL